MRYERSTGILTRHEKLLGLIGEGTYSSRQLAVKLGVSEQTVYRDISFLKRHGHKITSIRVTAHWAYRLSVAPVNTGRAPEKGGANVR